jgi:hypothetical protein
MNAWLTVLDNALLPLGIAAAGAATTISVAGMQIRARQHERDQDRMEREEERSRHERIAEFDVRAEVIEEIASAFASYADTASASTDGKASDFAVKAQLLKLSTRCNTEHLSNACVAYVADASESPHKEHVLEVFSDIQRRLEGWHIGHLSLERVGELINEGHNLTRQHLVEHGIEVSRNH